MIRAKGFPPPAAFFNFGGRGGNLTVETPDNHSNQSLAHWLISESVIARVDSGFWFELAKSWKRLDDMSDSRIKGGRLRIFHYARDGRPISFWYCNAAFSPLKAEFDAMASQAGSGLLPAMSFTEQSCELFGFSMLSSRWLDALWRCGMSSLVEKQIFTLNEPDNDYDSVWEILHPCRAAAAVSHLLGIFSLNKEHASQIGRPRAIEVAPETCNDERALERHGFPTIIKRDAEVQRRMGRPRKSALNAEISRTLGLSIRRRREELGMTQQQLAEAIAMPRGLQTSVSTVQKHEKGTHSALSALPLYGDAMQCGPDYFLSDLPEPIRILLSTSVSTARK